MSKNKIVKIINDFNRIIKKLVLDLYNHDRNDSTVFRLKEEIKLGADLSPEILIMDAGPYLMKYKDQIYSGDDSFFINRNVEDIVDEGVSNEVLDLTHKIKVVWEDLDEEEQIDYKENVQSLLNLYIDYIEART